MAIGDIAMAHGVCALWALVLIMEWDDISILAATTEYDHAWGKWKRKTETEKLKIGSGRQYWLR